MRAATSFDVLLPQPGDPLTELRQRMRELAHARVRFGYRRIYMLRRREGWDVGKDRFYRVYCEENLGLRRKRPLASRIGFASGSKATRGAPQ
jgi:transposase InsO family protein